MAKYQVDWVPAGLTSEGGRLAKEVAALFSPVIRKDTGQDTAKPMLLGEAKATVREHYTAQIAHAKAQLKAVSSLRSTEIGDGEPAGDALLAPTEAVQNTPA
jgi:hypothetical protein